MDLQADITTVIPKDFPQLGLLLWNRDLSRPIRAREAFALYENNWRHVDVERLTASEAALIERLKQDYGNGFLLTAA